MFLFFFFKAVKICKKKSFEGLIKIKFLNTKSLFKYSFYILWRAQAQGKETKCSYSPK